MLRGVGDPIDVHEVDLDLMRRAIVRVIRYGKRSRLATESTAPAGRNGKAH